MIRRIITLFTLLVVISSCKAQSNNNIKQNKTSERTTEKFDTSTYYMERQGHEYQFEHYLRGKVRQFGGNNGSNYIEYAKKEKDLFGTYKEYYNRTATLKLVGKYYYNDFDCGIWKEYDENGYLIDEYDQDAPYKNYPWEKVEKFVKEELKLDLFDKKVSIRRYVSKHSKIPIWRIRWQVGIKVYTIKINANTGKIINQVEGEVEK